MTPEAAVYQFLSGFSMPAYASASVPDQDSPEWEGFPYLTYDISVSWWMDGDTNMPVNLWYRTEGEVAINAKAREIGRAIGDGGTVLACDGGAVWVKRGSPWSQAVNTEGSDRNVKRRYLNLSLEYLVTEET